MKQNLLPILLPIRSIVFLLTFVVCAWLSGTELSHIGHWWSIIAVVVNILTILLLIYAMQHCFIPTLLDGRYLLYRFLSFLPLTIILCWYYYVKRNPVPVMVGHAFIDLATAAQTVATSMIPGLYETMCGL